MDTPSWLSCAGGDSIALMGVVPDARAVPLVISVSRGHRRVTESHRVPQAIRRNQVIVA